MAIAEISNSWCLSVMILFDKLPQVDTELADKLDFRLELVRKHAPLTPQAPEPANVRSMVHFFNAFIWLVADLTYVLQHPNNGVDFLDLLKVPPRHDIMVDLLRDQLPLLKDLPASVIKLLDMLPKDKHTCAICHEDWAHVDITAINSHKRV